MYTLLQFIPNHKYYKVDKTFSIGIGLQEIITKNMALW